MPMIYTGSNGVKFIKIGNLPYGKPFGIVWISRKLFEWIKETKTPIDRNLYELFPLERSLLVKTKQGHWVLVYDEQHWTGDVFMKSGYGRKVDTYTIAPDPVARLEYVAYAGDREELGISTGVLATFPVSVPKVCARYRLKKVGPLVQGLQEEEWKRVVVCLDGKPVVEEDLGEDDDMLIKLVNER